MSTVNSDERRRRAASDIGCAVRGEEFLDDVPVVLEHRLGLEIADRRPEGLLGVAIKRLRGKLDYTAVGLELLPERFPLRALQEVHEAILGRPLTKPAFRRKMLDRGYLEPTGEREAAGAFRPAELYRRAGPHG